MFSCTEYIINNVTGMIDVYIILIIINNVSSVNIYGKYNK